ncbi:MAG: hypothetical protein NC548_38695 [Lachnospiraceae bacterium]|nr:hypothetical protein [Lachnospiraceae bacterium]
MDIINLKDYSVSHISFGNGKVVDQTDTSIKILFEAGVKQFQYPQAFEKFLICEDSNIQKLLLDLISEQKKQKEKEQKQRIQDIQNQTKIQAAINIPKGTGKKKYIKENIAFKCNYCNGGYEDNGIGYIRACSNDMIDYNIDTAHHSWCCDSTSPCRQYHDGLISRKELDSISNDGFVCYESQMLRNWTAFAGYVLTGENKQKPMKLNKVQINSLAVLTTRKPDTPESDRFVFAVFLVDEAYEGDNRDEGYVTTSSKYKLSLTEEESKQILFWNYYFNENAPKKAVWGQGLHRYISDMQAASILKDILEIKRGTDDGELAQEFLNHFCMINKIDPSVLPITEGALQRI